MRRAKLVAARASKNWILEEAAEHIGCAPNTLSRWELGTMEPSAYNRARLCAVYAMTAKELGIEEDESILLTDGLDNDTPLRIFLHADLTLHLVVLVSMHHGNRQKLQSMLARTIEEFTTMNTSHEATLTRREALQRLATMLPAFSILSGGIQRPIEDTLNQCAAGIIACEYLSKSTYEDMALAFSALSAYLPVLKTIAKESSLHRKEAARLATQCYLLLEVLGLHVEGPDVSIAKGYARLAVVYSEESSNLSLQLIALRTLAWAYNHVRQHKKALFTIERAQLLIEKKSENVSPHISSSIYSALAVLQVKNGVLAQNALLLAQETFLATNSDQANTGLADFDYARLIRDEGLAYYYQGMHAQALDAYERVIHPKDLSARVAMPLRTYVELLHYQTMAALKSPIRDMDRVISSWTLNVQGAINLRSQQRFDEVCLAYEIMQSVWPSERHITELQDHLVHW